MQRYNYPDLAAHRQSHQVFPERFKAFTQALEAGTLINPGEFFDVISTWFKRHMIEHDAPVARFLQARQAA